MNLLNTICSYWFDCIKNEDALEKDISIRTLSKAILYPFESDPFIFMKKDSHIKITDKKLIAFSKAKSEGLEFYYGYPLLFYRDQEANKDLVAPLLIIKVKFEYVESDTFLSKDELQPICGIQALTKLGLNTEEVSSINQLVENLFADNPNLDQQELAVQVLEIIKKEVNISINEDIKPSQLSNSKNLTHGMSAGLYNKSLIFAGETTVFNIHLVKDLLELRNKDDLEKTSLSFFSIPSAAEVQNDIVPILPFPSNEYQITAIQNIFRHSLSVITGPPGTGKSQFISNLIINLFLAGKSVLFVSHTGEAVNVVNSKINEQFKNLMLRTGKKDLRQELKGRFSELIVDYSKGSSKKIEISYIHSLWKTILEYRIVLLKIDGLQQRYQQKYFYQQELKNILVIQGSFIRKMKTFFEFFIIRHKLERINAKLRKLPSRIDFELKIRELEKNYYQSCQDFIRNIYLGKMVGNKEKIGLVNTFINRVSEPLFGDGELHEFFFINALQVLKIWSSTLKSIRGTFPLKAGIFDYVIFDEASQIDLPSAAPALYRAKKAIIVGDPMQLSHITGITKKIDFELAKTHGLTEMKEMYPTKIRYCDVSLFKAAENSLTHAPILLTNHYRSEDQIISLCNQVFYGGLLKIFSTLDYQKYPSSLPLGVLWVDVKGVVIKNIAGSRYNQIEVEKVYRVFKKVLEKVVDKDLSIGIVTPYSGQRQALNKIITENISPEIIEKHAVQILTAHQFQGSEKDIVIFSIVISSQGNGSSDNWYNIYPQILNVALSRARYLLFIVGDKEFCEKREGILGKIECVYNKMKEEEKFEKYDLDGKFDTPIERSFYQDLQKIGLEKLGYKLMAKYVAKRYTLDFAIVGINAIDCKKKFDIEIDGTQHEVIGGMPVCEDIERDRYLREKEGWVILRYPNHRVLSEMPKIIEELLIIIKE